MLFSIYPDLICSGFVNEDDLINQEKWASRTQERIKTFTSMVERNDLKDSQIQSLKELIGNPSWLKNEKRTLDAPSHSSQKPQHFTNDTKKCPPSGDAHGVLCLLNQREILNIDVDCRFL